MQLTVRKGLYFTDTFQSNREQKNATENELKLLILLHILHIWNFFA